MSLKKLPKAITRTSEDMREIAAGAVAAEQRKRPVRRRVAKEPPDEEAAALPRAPRRVAIKAEPAPEISPPPVVGEVLPPISTQAESEAGRLRAQARKIVKGHAAYAAVGGLLPLPIATVAGVTAIIVRMVKVLSDLYGVPFERDRARSIVIGLMGGAVPTGLGVAAASTLALVVPGGGLVVGLAVSSIAAVACTRGIGLIFVEHFESGATSLDVTVIQRA